MWAARPRQFRRNTGGIGLDDAISSASDERAAVSDLGRGSASVLLAPGVTTPAKGAGRVGKNRTWQR